MAELKLKINDKIEVVDENNTYRSIIHDIDKNGIYIDTPISGSNYYLMHSGKIFEFYYASDNEIYKCESIVKSKKRDGNLELIELTFPKVIERVQRREYFRLQISMEISYCILPRNNVYRNIKDVSTGYMNKMETTSTIDISGGGIKIITRKEIHRNQNVLVTLYLPEKVTLLCTVVRIDLDNETKFYKVGMRFENIDERNRDRIIRFIFAKVREQTKLLR